MNSCFIYTNNSIIIANFQVVGEILVSNKNSLLEVGADWIIDGISDILEII